ncbi:MAG: cytidylate kinase family protein [bacterium]
MIISLSGLPGSGKSFIAEKLAHKLGWPRYYMGGLRRKMAEEKGLTLAEYNKLGETDPSTDLEVDTYQRKLGQTEDNFVIEGRTSWYFIPKSLKIFLSIDPRVGSERIFKELQEENNRNEDAGLHTIEDVIESNAKRMASDNRRYQKYFNIDAFDENNFDYVLDTSNLSKDEVFEKVLAYVEKTLGEKLKV